ncbi:MAG TPA: hypothetical protein VGR73_11920 [Bryobacteraceae bacterium]|nr:hypothetical protein [Bryobacteraceae bacterium]
MTPLPRLRGRPPHPPRLSAARANSPGNAASRVLRVRKAVLTKQPLRAAMPIANGVDLAEGPVEIAAREETEVLAVPAAIAAMIGETAVKGVLEAEPGGRSKVLRPISSSKS